MATTNMTELKTAEAFLRQHFPQGGKVLCALSGGLDSMCLAHFMMGQKGFSVTAAHFNHRLRGERSDADQCFVEEWCLQNRLPFFVGEGDTRKRARETGESIEEAARCLRYEFLQQVAREGGYDAILTAHHAEDNAETVLLHLLRGTGTAGLGGIPAVRGNLYRPFLQLSKETLRLYAKERDIPHVEDETNETDDAARNLLRHRVLPVLKELNPKAVAHIGRTAAIMAGESAAMETLARRIADGAEQTTEGTVLPCAALTEEPEALARRAILVLLGRAAGGRKDLTAAHADAVWAICQKQRGEVHLPGGVTVERDGETLLFARRETAPEEVSITPGQTVAFGPWRVYLSDAPIEGGTQMSLPAGAALTVTPWRRDDRMTVPGSRGSRSVKRLCVDRGISPQTRDALPVLRADGKIAAMAQVGFDLDLAPDRDRKPVYIRFYQTIEGEKV